MYTLFLDVSVQPTSLPNNRMVIQCLTNIMSAITRRRELHPMVATLIFQAEHGGTRIGHVSLELFLTMVLLSVHRRIAASSAEPSRPAAVATRPRHVIHAVPNNMHPAPGQHRVPGMSAPGSAGGVPSRPAVATKSSQPLWPAKRHWDIPHDLQMKLDSWGPSLLRRVTACRLSWLQ